MTTARRRFARMRDDEREAVPADLSKEALDHGPSVDLGSVIASELRSSELSALGIYTHDAAIPDLRRRGLTMSERRRRGPRTQDGGLDAVSPTVAFVEDADGVLRLEQAPGLVPAEATTLMRQRRPRARGRAAGTRELDADLAFAPFPPNQVGEVLRSFDFWRCPRETRGLRRVRQSGGSLSFEAVHAPVADPRVLVIVHGTASCGEHVATELWSSPAGRAWLAKRMTAGPVFLFNHATLSVSPFLNALDLGAALERFVPNAQAIDVVCHSRGGLVTRWWAECVERRRDRVGRTIFVGAPLAGTSLAAPGALKAFIESTANTARAIATVSGKLGAVLPQLGALTSLVAILSRVWAVGASALASLPVADAVIAAIPGLSAMSRVVRNEESDRLLGSLGASLPDGAWYDARYRFVAADYEPENPSWRIWRYLTDAPLARALDAGADRLFPGENDLVVDTESMTALRRGPSTPLDIGEGERLEGHEVHHVSYFQSPKVIGLLDGWTK